MIKEVLKYQKKLKTGQNKSFCCIRDKEIALQNPYIQANPSNSFEWIIIDCDYDVPYYDDLPVQPNYIVRNKDNNRAHLYFKISAVHNNESSSYRAIEYYNAVKFSLTCLFNGDLGFSQTLSKNPLAVDIWRVESLHEHEYDLGELAEYCTLESKKETKPANCHIDALGRNQHIFDSTRYEAYKLRKPSLDQVLSIANKFNSTLSTPLLINEVTHIAKSIWRFLSKPRAVQHKEYFLLKQSERGKKSGQKRAEKYQTNKNKAFIYLSNKSFKLKDIALKLGVGLSTIKKYLAEFKKVYRTKSGSPQVSFFYGGRRSTDIDNYLSDNFSLYSESESTSKVPICTINRLLQ